MSKQEEIREGIAEGLFKFDHPYEEWGTQSSKTASLYQHRADRLLAWENENGVVIKVDRQLYDIGIEYYNENVAKMLKAGYVATEPLAGD